MMNQFNYGHMIELYPVIDAEEAVSVFLPQLFPWEKEKSAKIILHEGEQILVNTEAQLLQMTDKGIKTINIPFCNKKDKYICYLQEFLRKNKISFEPKDGICCDGSRWNQNEFTGKVLYCSRGILQLVTGPYWGSQYEFYFADQNIRPILGGKQVKIIRFSRCSRDIWFQAETWFRYLIRKKRILNFRDLCYMLRNLNLWFDCDVNGISLFVKTEKDEFDWFDLGFSAC